MKNIENARIARNKNIAPTEKEKKLGERKDRRVGEN